jgi:hypothetical protein
LQGPIGVLAVTNHNPQAQTARDASIMAILATSIIIGTRITEPLADLALGLRTTFNIHHGQCVANNFNSCRPHIILASTIIVGSVVDLILGFASIFIIPSIFPSVPFRTKILTAEICMLVSECAVLCCTLIMVHLGINIQASGGRDIAIFDDLPSYALLCAATTFLLMMTTCIAVFTPARIYDAFARHGLRGAYRELVSRRARAPELVVARSAVHPASRSEG